MDDYTYGVTYAAPNIPSITNMDLVAFIACNTAYGGEGAANLPTYAVSRGAETAIGFTEQILCTQANEWTKAFFALLENGYSVKAACEDLETYPEYRAGNLDSYIICGNKSKTIN